MNGVNWAMMLAIKSSFVDGFGVGFGRIGRTGAGIGFTTTGVEGNPLIVMKLGSLVLVSLYPSASAMYLTVIRDPSGST